MCGLNQQAAKNSNSQAVATANYGGKTGNVGTAPGAKLSPNGQVAQNALVPKAQGAGAPTKTLLQGGGGVKSLQPTGKTLLGG